MNLYHFSRFWKHFESWYFTKLSNEKKNYFLELVFAFQWILFLILYSSAGDSSKNRLDDDDENRWVLFVICYSQLVDTSHVSTNYINLKFLVTLLLLAYTAFYTIGLLFQLCLMTFNDSLDSRQRAVESIFCLRHLTSWPSSWNCITLYYIILVSWGVCIVYSRKLEEIPFKNLKICLFRLLICSLIRLLTLQYVPYWFFFAPMLL